MKSTALLKMAGYQQYLTLVTLGLILKVLKEGTRLTRQMQFA